MMDEMGLDVLNKVIFVLVKVYGECFEMLVKVELFICNE